MGQTVARTEASTPTGDVVTGPRLRPPSIPAVVFVLLAVVVPTALQTPLLNSDGDLARHLRHGQYMLDQGGLIRIDAFSFTRPGAPFVGFEYGSQLLYAGRATGGPSRSRDTGRPAHRQDLCGDDGVSFAAGSRSATRILHRRAGGGVWDWPLERQATSLFLRGHCGSSEPPGGEGEAPPGGSGRRHPLRAMGQPPRRFRLRLDPDWYLPGGSLGRASLGKRAGVLAGAGPVLSDAARHGCCRDAGESSRAGALPPPHCVLWHAFSARQYSRICIPQFPRDRRKGIPCGAAGHVWGALPPGSTRKLASPAAARCQYGIRIDCGPQRASLRNDGPPCLCAPSGPRLETTARPERYPRTV